MRQVSNFCDYFVILSASSFRRAQTISEHIQEGLSEKNTAIRAHEGDEESQWLLLDLFDVVVHIFVGNNTRGFYNLEKLWQDAPVVAFPVHPVRKVSGPRRAKPKLKKQAAPSGRAKKDDHKQIRRPAKRTARRSPA